MSLPVALIGAGFCAIVAAVSISPTFDGGEVERVAAGGAAATPISGRGPSSDGLPTPASLFGELAERLGQTPEELAAARARALREDPFTARDRRDLKALRDRHAARLGRQIDRSGAEVLREARAVLAEGATTAERRGVLSAEGRRLVLGCFDEPGRCRLSEVRDEIDPRALRALPGAAGRGPATDPPSPARGGRSA